MHRDTGHQTPKPVPPFKQRVWRLLERILPLLLCLLLVAVCSVFFPPTVLGVLALVMLATLVLCATSWLTPSDALLITIVAVITYMGLIVWRELFPPEVPVVPRPASWTSLVHGGSSVMSAMPLSAVNGIEQFTTSLFLLAQGGVVAEFRTKLKEALNIVMLIGFLYGTVRIISGASQIHRGDSSEGTSSILSGALIAAAPLMMRILYEVFFEKGGSVFG